MVDLSIRRRNGGHHPEQKRLATQQPRSLRDLLRWDPFSEMEPIVGLQLMEGVLAAFDVKETPDAYVFKADLPGFTEKDLDITAAGNRLTISGSRSDEREDKGDTYFVAERRYGAFNRSFTLPEGVDVEKVKAALKQGVLTVTVPRTSGGAGKKIPVKALSDKS